MPRYFFHVDDHQSSQDHDGTILTDVRAARSGVLHYAASLLAYLDPKSVSHREPFRIRVTDQGGNEVVILEIQDKAVEHAGS